MSIPKTQAFFQGYNPYTGAALNQPNSPPSYAPAPPPQQDLVVPTPVNPNEVLDPLYAAQQQLSKAKSGLDKVHQFWGRVESEVRSAGNQTNRAQSDLYPAESDSEEIDHSRTGSWAASSLDQIERGLSRLQWDSSTPTYAIFEIKQQLSAAQSYLSSVDASRLPYPFRHQQAQQNLSDFQSRLYRIEQSQSQLESKLSSVQQPINSARYEINAVAGDVQGQSVAYQARSAGGHLNNLSQQLQQVEQHLRYSNSDLTQAESALSAAEQSILTSHQEYQYSWHTCDKRS